MHVLDLCSVRFLGACIRLLLAECEPSVTARKPNSSTITMPFNNDNGITFWHPNGRAYDNAVAWLGEQASKPCPRFVMSV